MRANDRNRAWSGILGYQGELACGRARCVVRKGGIATAIEQTCPARGKAVQERVAIAAYIDDCPVRGARSRGGICRYHWPSSKSNGSR
jgi:hypothetical protein